MVTVQDVMQRPLDSPLLPSEEHLQSRLAKRSLASSPEDSVLKVITGGQVTNCALHINVNTHYYINCVPFFSGVIACSQYHSFNYGSLD